ncbi:HEAT repeat protein [Methanofollis sp. W23]|uniref:HEAT repeat domain-containing protein n=1 Tax=Methanofollis sp. W23 TaxID=2817849 RepID=UPI001AE652DA|nr:HEAT repeat domain-containing protein [Methanofollis sp. W23]MBP2145439.1 HEAT repeat protein [Methanofollis sp. W23]
MSEKPELDRVPPLIDALSTPLLRVRSIAVAGLARQRDARALGPIIESVRGLDGADVEDVCQYISDVIEALASFGDRTALKPLVSLLDAEFDDLHPIVWNLTEDDRSAIESMAELYVYDVEPLKEIMYGPYSVGVKKMMISLLMEVDTLDADRVLLDLVQDREVDEYLVSEAIYVLGVHGCRDAFEPICRVMADRERYTDDTRSSAAVALGRIGDQRALAPLVVVLADQDDAPYSMTAECAADALEMLVLDEDEEEWGEEPVEGDDEVFGVLIEALASPDPDMQVLGVRGLGALGDSRAVPQILEALRNWEESEEYLTFCREAITAVGTIGDASAVTPLFETLDEIEQESEVFTDHFLNSQELYEEAFQAVAGMGEEIVGTLHEIVAGEYGLVIRAMAVQTLEYFHDQYSEAVLIEALENRDEQEVAAWAADALGRRGSTGAVAPLCRVACDTRHYEDICRLSAIGALGEIGDPRALRTLLEMISKEEHYGERASDAYEAFESIIEMMEDRRE